ncbi:hypothetical protein FJZ31_03925 [Candidatus Poribacteria bacterium]|nr:hypothetical protein [Candidatus Poribacteria bacterium]
MYTKEDFLRDYPPKEHPFVFPWEKEYHEKAIQEATQQGIEQGVEQGIEKNKLETARKMLAEGVEISFILRITGLSEDDILTLKAE